MRGRPTKKREWGKSNSSAKGAENAKRDRWEREKSNSSAKRAWTRSLGKIDFPLSLPFLRLQAMEYCNYRIDPHSITLIPAKLYKLIAILRQQFCIILTASWKKIPITGLLLRRQYVVRLTSLKQSKETENHDTILYSPLTAKRFTFI